MSPPAYIRTFRPGLTYLSFDPDEVYCGKVGPDVHAVNLCSSLLFVQTQIGRWIESKRAMYGSPESSVEKDTIVPL